MNMALTKPLKELESKSSGVVLSADKKRRLKLKMEDKVKALLFELEPRIVGGGLRHEQQEQMTAPLILDNSVIAGQSITKDGSKTSEFPDQSKISKFQSLLTNISKAMVALEKVRQCLKLWTQILSKKLTLI